MALNIGISGKRLIGATEQELVRQEIKMQIKALMLKHKTNSFTGYTSLAIGADTIFADVVTRTFKMPLQIILPLPVPDYERDFSETDKLVLHGYLKNQKSGNVKYMHLQANEDKRDQAYFDAGVYIADRCDEMIFVWDELKPNGHGGTGEILGYYAEKKNCYSIDYIKVSSQNTDKLDDELKQNYGLANNIAERRRDDYKGIWMWVLGLGLCSVLCFAFSTAYAKILEHNELIIVKLMLSGAEVLFVFIVYGLIVKAKARDYHGNYLRKRVESEKLRILRCYYHAGITVDVPDFINESAEPMLTTINSINQAVKNSDYLSKWYGNYKIKALIHEQINYHTGKVKKIGSKYQRFETANVIIAIVFIINLLLHFISELLETRHVGFLQGFAPIFTLLTISLPALYAAIEGFLYFQEWSQLKEFSLAACNYFDTLLKSAETNETGHNWYKQQSQLLNDAAKFMLTDGKNWTLLFDDKNNYHWIV